MASNDIQRLREAYALRRKRLAGSNIYSSFNLAHLFMIQQRERRVLQTLRRQDIQTLGDKYILELGCGNGGVLLEYLHHGANPSKLHGVDLLEDRIQHARRMLPLSSVLCADGQLIPYADGIFDLVIQYTAFSSVLDDQVKQNMAAETLRVLKKGGFILWYDFWINPRNSQTKGIRASEIRLLFPNCRYEFQKITLAPPITRRLVKLSWLMCSVLENLGLFNTHYLTVIKPE